MLMLSLPFILFVIIVSQPSINYPRARFVFVLLRYVHEKKFEKIIIIITGVGERVKGGLQPPLVEQKFATFGKLS